MHSVVLQVIVCESLEYKKFLRPSGRRPASLEKITKEILCSPVAISARLRKIGTKKNPFLQLRAICDKVIRGTDQYGNHKINSGQKRKFAFLRDTWSAPSAPFAVAPNVSYRGIYLEQRPSVAFVPVLLKEVCDPFTHLVPTAQRRNEFWWNSI